MAVREVDVHGDGTEPQIGELIRQFGQDATTLVRQELALAKLELRSTAAEYARDARRLGIAVVLGWMGALALVATVILGLGALLGSYWLSGLIVSIVLLATAAVLGRSGVQDMKRTSPMPEETLQTLQEDRRWARDEARDFRRQLKH